MGPTAYRIRMLTPNIRNVQSLEGGPAQTSERRCGGGAKKFHAWLCRCWIARECVASCVLLGSVQCIGCPDVQWAAGGKGEVCGPCEWPGAVWGTMGSACDSRIARALCARTRLQLWNDGSAAAWRGRLPTAFGHLLRIRSVQSIAGRRAAHSERYYGGNAEKLCTIWCRWWIISWWVAISTPVGSVQCFGYPVVYRPAGGIGNATVAYVVRCRRRICS